MPIDLIKDEVLAATSRPATFHLTANTRPGGRKALGTENNVKLTDDAAAGA